MFWICVYFSYRAIFANYADPLMFVVFCMVYFISRLYSYYLAILRCLSYYHMFWLVFLNQVICEKNFGFILVIFNSSQLFYCAHFYKATWFLIVWRDVLSFYYLYYMLILFLLLLLIFLFHWLIFVLLFSYFYHILIWVFL